MIIVYKHIYFIWLHYIYINDIFVIIIIIMYMYICIIEILFETSACQKQIFKQIEILRWKVMKQQQISKYFENH